MVTTDYVVGYYNPQLMQDLCDLDMCPVGTHSVTHSLLTNAPRGDCDITAAQYDAHEVTVCGEVRASLELLERDVGTRHLRRHCSGKVRLSEVSLAEHRSVDRHTGRDHHRRTAVVAHLERRRPLRKVGRGHRRWTTAEQLGDLVHPEVVAIPQNQDQPALRRQRGDQVEEVRQLGVLDAEVVSFLVEGPGSGSPPHLPPALVHDDRSKVGTPVLHPLDAAAVDTEERRLHDVLGEVTIPERHPRERDELTSMSFEQLSGIVRLVAHLTDQLPLAPHTDEECSRPEKLAWQD
jgi:hypothetical protein